MGAYEIIEHELSEEEIFHPLRYHDIYDTIKVVIIIYINVSPLILFLTK